MRPIRNSAKAVIIHNEHVLLTKNEDDRGSFYLFPGGGQEHGESLHEAVRRECIEEIGQEVIVNDLLYVREYIGKNHQFAEWDSDVHQVEFYFSCELKEQAADIANGINPDEMQIGVEWVKFSDLEHIRVYPQILAPILIGKLRSGAYLGDVN